MDQELRGITAFLIERAKKVLKTQLTMYKAYFIIRYSGKDKLVYSPIDCDDLLERGAFHLVPARIQDKWLSRKLTDPENTELVATLIVYTSIYDSKDRTNPNWGRAGIAATVNTKYTSMTLLLHYDYTAKGIIYDERIVEVPAGEPMIKTFIQNSYKIC